MIKHSFKNDYSEGAHPNILKALKYTNFNQEEGYSEDSFCFDAKELILHKINNLDADVHFVSGGTQANVIVISSILNSYESVIAANTGHITVHEAGAIEATGHKINSVDTANGKLSPEDIESVLDFHTDEHMVRPKLVFISNSTEIGSIYKKKELEELSSFCRLNDLYLYLDGARLGSALASPDNDLSLSDITKLVDVFYIGGTKNGALLGEAIVIINDEFKNNFRYYIKQKGALLAKGRLLGIQFQELFKDDLFFKLAKHANSMALKLATAFSDFGYEFLTKPVSNQIFPILPNDLIKKLSKKYDFYIWSKIDNDMSGIRLVCSWATKEKIIDEFILDLGSLVY